MYNAHMRYPLGKAKAVTFSYDDGIIQDKRLAELFDKYGVKGTFNFNCEKRRKFNFSKEEINEIFLSKGHEIAVHGANHRANGYLRPVAGVREVLECRIELEKKTDRIIRGMAYPDSGINRIANFTSYSEIKAYLTELGIAYARTLGRDNDAFLLPDDFHAWIPSAHHDNPEIMEYIDKFINLDISPEVYYTRRFPRLLYIWGHSYEFDRKDNWEHMEDILKKLSGNEEIWYATNIEIYDYVKAYNSLVYSADESMIYNPTLYQLWMDIDGKLISIDSGETVCVE